MGGVPGEHEISLQSAASVIRNLDRERFEVVPIAIDKQGRWLLNDSDLIQEAWTRARASSDLQGRADGRASAESSKPGDGG